jgi:hypothetical protein
MFHAFRANSQLPSINCNLSRENVEGFIINKLFNIYYNVRLPWYNNDKSE